MKQGNSEASFQHFLLMKAAETAALHHERTMAEEQTELLSAGRALLNLHYRDLTTVYTTKQK